MKILFFHLEGEQAWKAFQLHMELHHNLSTMKVMITMCMKLLKCINNRFQTQTKLFNINYYHYLYNKLVHLSPLPH